MDKSLNATPVASRTHIGFFGRMNAGKSSLINVLADQGVSIVSEQPGTTTDVVKKTMEIHGIGPCVLLDTAGFDDESVLGSQRTQASVKASASADIAVLVMADAEDLTLEKAWILRFESRKIPVVAVLTHADLRSDAENEAISRQIKEELGLRPLVISCMTDLQPDEESSAAPGESRKAASALKEALIRSAGRMEETLFIMGDLVQEGSVVLLVMPQDPQAPQGRLILPEVQTIRECLDRHCVCVCVQPEDMEQALNALGKAPDLIITDSQVFDEVYAKTPAESKLTSFSVLFAGYKGDIGYYMDSVQKIRELTGESKVLIAECCTHAPLDEDIGRVKIPAMLRRRIGQDLTVDVAAGNDFPENAKDYDLIIQCGGCMLNRRAVCARIEKARQAGVPMTNYVITIAFMKGILDKVVTGRQTAKQQLFPEQDDQ